MVHFLQTDLFPRHTKELDSIRLLMRGGSFGRGSLYPREGQNLMLDLDIDVE